MNAILDFLNFPLFYAFGAPTTVLEVIAFVAGGLCVYGVAKQYQWNWPVAIINAAAFVLLFCGVGLYADMMLQFVFIALSIYGWINWGLGKGGKAAGKSDLPVRRMKTIEYQWLSPLFIVAYGAAILWLHSLTDSTVYIFDAFILVASLAATYMQTKKIVESWWVWIAVDVVSIPLYFYKGLMLTGILYVVFLTLCIIGLRDWTKALRSQPTWEDYVNFTPHAINNLGR